MADMDQLDTNVRVTAEKLKNSARDSLTLVQAAFLSRGAAGIKTAQRRFKIMDDDGSKNLCFDEFQKGIRDVGVRLTKEQELELFSVFDRDHQGTINFDEFLRTVTPPMNNRRRRLVIAAFAKMDNTGDGIITVKDLAKTYNVKKHPKYISGQWTETKVLQEYLKTFEAEGNDDGNVDLKEFMSYYASISCSIDHDDYFDLIMRNSWGQDLAV